MELKQQKKLEDYLIAKNKSYAVYGLTRNEIKSEFLLGDSEAEKHLKRKFCYTIGEAIQLLIKIENENETGE